MNMTFSTLKELQLTHSSNLHLKVSPSVVVTWSLLIFSCMLIVLLEQFARKYFLNLPPGPAGLPIVGSLFSLKADLHNSFALMAKKYGPVFHLRLGAFDAIVVSSVELAEELYRTKDADFSSRPHCTVSRSSAKYFGFDGNDIGFAGYSNHLRLLRKICTTELLTVGRLNATAKIRRDEIAIMVQNIATSVQNGENVNVREDLHSMTMNMMSRVLFGKRYYGKNVRVTTELLKFKDVVYSLTALMGKLNIADLIPALEWFDPQGLKGEYKKVKCSLESLFGKILADHREANAELSKLKEDPDFVDVLLSIQDENELTDKVIMGVLNDMLIGGTDNAASTLEWGIAELVRHPEILTKLQKEIDDIVGRERLIEESDIPQLPYLQAVVKEVFRLHNPLPLLIPRMNDTPTTLGGYHIPRHSTIYFNLWSITRDPLVWENPLLFDPERFLSSNVSVHGNNFKLLPFGSGRRKCVGITLGLLMVHRTLAAMVQAFDWTPPQGKTIDEVDITEEFGLTLRLAQPLVISASPRFPESFYSVVI